MLVFRQNVCRHLHTGCYYAARIVAQVNDQALHTLLFQIRHRSDKLLCCHSIKLGYFYISGLIRQHLVLYGSNLHHTPLNMKRYFLAPPQNSNIHIGAFLTADVLLNQNVKFFIRCRDILYLIDDIAFLHARLFCRGTRENAERRHCPGLHILADQHTNATVYTAGLLCQGTVLLRSIINGVRIIQSGQHAFVDSGFHLLRVFIEQEIPVDDLLKHGNFCIHLF